MNRTVLGIAALTAIVFAAGPGYIASARAANCSGPDQTRIEAVVQGTADGPNRIMAQTEVMQAQTAMLKGDMAGCAAHLVRAERDATMRGIPPKAMQPAPLPAPTAPLKPAL
jgi:hypothetical protein